MRHPVLFKIYERNCVYTSFTYNNAKLTILNIDTNMDLDGWFSQLSWSKIPIYWIVVQVVNRSGTRPPLGLQVSCYITRNIYTDTAETLHFPEKSLNKKALINIRKVNDSFNNKQQTFVFIYFILWMIISMIGTSTIIHCYR